MSEKKMSPALQQAIKKLKEKGCELNDLPKTSDPDAESAWNDWGQILCLEPIELLVLKNYTQQQLRLFKLH